MIVELKTIELKQKKFAEYIKAKGRFKWQVDLTDFACFIYWLNGKNKLYVGNRQIESRGKDALLLKCGSYIDELFPTGEEEIEALIIHLYPDLLKNLFRNQIPEALINTHSSELLPIKLGPHNLLEKYVDNLLLYFKHPEITDDDLLSLKMRELVLLLCKTQQRNTLAQIFKHLFTPEQLSFHEVIEGQLYSGLSLKELAYLTHRSMASFKRDFQKYYQASPAHYIKNKRLEKASQLLIFTQLRITDIVFECGFTNVSHFTRLFHQKYKLSPSTFRMSQTANSLS